MAACAVGGGSAVVVDGFKKSQTEQIWSNRAQGNLPCSSITERRTLSVVVLFCVAGNFSIPLGGRDFVFDDVEHNPSIHRVPIT